jgi:autotransporter-associated beta strand protein
VTFTPADTIDYTSVTLSVSVTVNQGIPQAFTQVKAPNATALNQAGSWVSGVLPGPGDIGEWNDSATVAGDTITSLGGAFSLGEIQIANNVAGPVSISDTAPGDILTLNGATGTGVGIDMSQAANNLTIDCAVELGAGQAWWVTNGTTLSINGVISGAFPLLLDNEDPTNGTVSFGAQANTWSGGTLINGGLVQLSATTSTLGTGPITNNGAVLSVAAETAIPNNLVFTNTSIINLNGGGGGNNSWNGAWSGNGTIIISNLAVPGSTLTIGGGAATATMNDFNGNLIVAPLTSGGLISQGTLRFNSGSTPYNFGSAGASFDLGPNNNIYLSSREGGTINLGELIGGPGNVLLGSRSTAGTTVWSVGGLNTSTTFAGAISNYTGSAGTGVAALTKVGTGTLTLTGPNNAGGATGATGPTVISGGILQIGDGVRTGH